MDLFQCPWRSVFFHDPGQFSGLWMLCHYFAEKSIFGVSLRSMYGFEFKLAERLGFVKKQNEVYSLTRKGAFYYHYYENYYTLAYIDKMWGIMRDEPFPAEIRL